MSIIGSNILAGAAGSGVSAYEIEQSLRFDGSAQLTRTVGNNGGSRSFTFSVWLKKSRQGDTNFTMLKSMASDDSEWAYFNFGESSGDADQITCRSKTSGGYVFSTSPARKYRDPSSWMHLVLKVDKSANTATGYVNGEQVGGTAGAGGWTFNKDVTGDNLHLGQNLDGYLAEAVFVDNQALDPDSFGEYDDNNVWRPIDVSGLTFGTNGWYLTFDPSATNGIGHDHSGNGNNFTANNFTTSGTGTDVMSDTPTNNFATLNAVDASTQNVPAAFREGNLEVEHRSGSGNYSLAVSTIAFDSDDSNGFYFESIATDYVGSSYQSVCLIDASKTVQEFIGNAPVGGSTGSTFGIGWESSSGYLRNFGSTVSGWGPTTTTWTSDGDILMVFVKNNKVYLGKNGTWLQSADPSTESNPAITLSSAYKLKPGTAGRYSAKQSFNFGQRDFSYTPPTGAKTLCTSNLPAPDIADGSDYFNTVLYTGNGSTQSITGVGFQPDWIWIKRRSASEWHLLSDSVRGVNAQLASNTTYQEQSRTDQITSFDTDGFSLGTDGAGYSNANTSTYVAWNWLAGGSGSSNTDGSITSTVSANPSAGFSIVSYTGTNADDATVGHGLGVKPAFIIVKNRDYADYWMVEHPALASNKNLVLNLTNAETAWGSGVVKATSSTVFTLKTNVSGSNENHNRTDDKFIAYCFAEVEGYSKFGSYTGTGGQQFVHLGFSPEFVMIKRSDSASDTHSWFMFDATRDPINNNANEPLIANKAFEEGRLPDGGSGSIGNIDFDFLSNGFGFPSYQGSGINASGATMIYAAFAKNPFGGDGVSPATAR